MSYHYYQSVAKVNWLWKEPLVKLVMWAKYMQGCLLICCLLISVAKPFSVHRLNCNRCLRV